MNDKPTISVIVPVFNVERYLQQCVDSILSQSFDAFELILVDDGSTDSSNLLCDKYAREDDRIKVVHKVNAGVSAARNTGIDIANGKYIAFVDSDDFVDRAFLETLVSTIEASKADLSVVGFSYYYDPQKSVDHTIAQDGVYSVKRFVKMMFKESYEKHIISSVCNKLFRKELVELYQLKYSVVDHICEDGMFVYDYLMHCASIAFNSSVLYIYRQVTNQPHLMTKYNSNAFESLDKYYQSILAFLSKHEAEMSVYDFVDYSFLRRCFGFLSNIYRSSNLPNERKYEELLRNVKDGTFQFFLTRSSSLSLSKRETVFVTLTRAKLLRIIDWYLKYKNKSASING